MKTDNGELVKNITVEYTSYFDFNLEEILNEYNEKNNTEYKSEDIVDYYIEGNNLHLIMSDKIEIKYKGVLETDYKIPNEVYFNNKNTRKKFGS